MVFDGRFKLIRGYDPTKRTGGDNFESMHMSAEDTVRFQEERPQLLFDLKQNERDDVSDDFPDELRRLEMALDAHLKHVNG